MACQQCLDRWGQEPFYMGDTSAELIAYYKHRIFHLGEDIEVPWFFRDEVYDESF